MASAFGLSAQAGSYTCTCAQGLGNATPTAAALQPSLPVLCPARPAAPPQAGCTAHSARREGGGGLAVLASVLG